MTSRTRVRATLARLLIALTAVVMLTVSFTAGRTETITYTYDAKGRLVTVYHGTTGPNAGVTASYGYDNADNRTSLTSNAGSGTVTITLSPTTLPGGTVGTSYASTNITASGGTSPYTYSSSGTLPTGLSLSSGTLSGTPSAAGMYNFTVTATDSAANTGSQAYTVTISATPTITLSPATVPNGAVGSAYSKSITASGGTSPYTYTYTGTLDGLSLSSGGVLSGTPSATGTYNFTVTAKDHNNYTGSKSYTLTVNAAISLSPATLPGGTVGTAYSAQLSATGGSSPFTFALSSGALPTSVSLSSAGALSGTPSAAGTFPFTVKATDNAGNAATKSYTVTIASGGTTTIQLASSDHNLRTVANANGYTGSSPANYTFVVGSGVTVTGAAGGIGIDTGSWPTGVTLALDVNNTGIVRGGGGNGGNGGSDDGTTLTQPTAGGAGGDAVKCSTNVSIVVASGGTVQAGGGGGGGGGVNNSNPALIPGGGGGGGAPNGAGGAGGAGHLAGAAAAGSAGTTTGGGAGGGNGIPGGAGGTYATAGSSGTNGAIANGAAGGAAGYAVRKNGTGCTVTNNGTVTGTVG